MRRAALRVGHVSIAYGAGPVQAALQSWLRRGAGDQQHVASFLLISSISMRTIDATNEPSVPVPATILIVEDDAATSEFFADLLDFAGYQTYVAASGADALAHGTQHPVQLVLLDRRLPDMDGLDVGRALRTALPASVPIILLTADHSRALGDAARTAGMDAYLPKPVDPQVLLDRIAALLPAV